MTTITKNIINGCGEMNRMTCADKLWVATSSNFATKLFLRSFIVILSISLALGVFGLDAAVAQDVQASFDCREASSLVEKLICSDADLAELDSWLADAFSNARSDARDANQVRDQQRAWLRDTRNTCSTVECLRAAYSKRLDQLEPPITVEEQESRSVGTPKETTLGRCHQATCWWWGIDDVKPIKTAPTAVLMSVTNRTAAASFSRLYLKSHAYPDDPPIGLEWSATDKIHVLCSKDMPLVCRLSQREEEFRWNTLLMRMGRYMGQLKGLLICTISPALCIQWLRVKSCVACRLSDSEM